MSLQHITVLSSNASGLRKLNNHRWCLGLKIQVVTYAAALSALRFCQINLVNLCRQPHSARYTWRKDGAELTNAPVEIDEDALDPERVVQRQWPTMVVLAAALLVHGHPVLVLAAADEISVRRRQ
jgi:hypothetical protein